MNIIIRRIILIIAISWSCGLHAFTGEATTGNVIVDTRGSVITSTLSEQQISLRKLMTRYAVTTNFGASTFSARGLPPGVSINKNTGVISGKPTKKGTYTVTITAQKRQGTKVVNSATAKKVFKVV
jgi:hypothetical protein